jgi:hypothetical protein
MVFVASHWTPASDLRIRVFSNCEEVGLALNGELLERRGPDADRLSSHISHPPFTFQMKRFEPGTLEAIGYIEGRKAARHVVRTPGAAKHLELKLDESWRPFAAGGKDAAFLRARLLDDAGTLVADGWENVWFGATGDVELVGANPFSSEAGVGSILVQSEISNPRGTVYALCLVRQQERIRLLAAAYPFRQAPNPFEIRVTTDGSDPSNGAVHHDGSLIPADRVRAELAAGGRRVLEADTESPKFRIAGSTAPE